MTTGPDNRQGLSATAEQAPPSRDGTTEHAEACAFIARWDLDKTYLRTDFDTLRDLLKTAIERPDQKRTVPGAAALLRELGRHRVETHILSGSPEQLRGRLVEKLRLDGVKWASLTLKPNLQNLLRLRFRALRGQLGYKFPELVTRRAQMQQQRSPRGDVIREILLGDDAEADAFVYSLYADLCRGAASAQLVGDVLRIGGAYEDSIRDALRFGSMIETGEVVTRILIHLDRQSAPSEFRIYGPRVVPFFNYLQAALILYQDGVVPAESVLRVAADLIVRHNFDSRALARSYLDLARRGHLLRGVGELRAALDCRLRAGPVAAASELYQMLDTAQACEAPVASPIDTVGQPDIDYLRLVNAHNPRRKRHS